MSKSPSRFVTVIKHFHRLLALMAGAITVALLVPLFCHLIAEQIPEADFIARFIMGGDSSPKADLVHLLYNLTFLQGFGLSLVAGIPLIAPLAYSAYQSAKGDQFPA
jgi:hypothetical protein